MRPNKKKKKKSHIVFCAFWKFLKEYADDSSLLLQKCVDDTVSPISIRLNFCQADSERASAVLNVDSRRQAVIEVCTVTIAEGCKRSVCIVTSCIVVFPLVRNKRHQHICSYARGKDMKLNMSCLEISKQRKAKQMQNSAIYLQSFCLFCLHGHCFWLALCFQVTWTEIYISFTGSLSKVMLRKWHLYCGTY